MSRKQGAQIEKLKTSGKKSDEVRVRVLGFGYKLILQFLDIDHRTNTFTMPNLP